MAKYNESDIQNALVDINNGMSVAEAGRKWGVPRTTLSGRKNCHYESHSQGAAHLQKVSPIQEAMLANWILAQGSLGFPPKHATIRHFASRMLDLAGCPTDLGINWMQQFLRRNPSVKTMLSERLEVDRAREANPTNIANWFHLFDNPIVKGISAEHRYNMDEAGIMEGLGTNGLVVGAAEFRKAILKEPNRGSWMSFVECVSATGHVLEPLVIFRGQTVQQQWFPDDELHRFRQWQFAASENGWTSNDNALEWLTKVFIPRTKPSQPQHRLLVLDGHGSHVTDEFMWQCYLNNIYVIYLPAHTSHILQPLDLSIFSPLKTAYRKFVGRIYAATDANPVGKAGFLVCLHKAREEAITTQNIKSGWRAAGLWPLNPRKPLRSDRLLPEKPKLAQTPPQTPPRMQGYTPLKTPRNGAEVFHVMHDTPKHENRRYRRHVARKVGKQLDAYIFQNSANQAEIQQLKLQLEGTKRKKKAQVRLDPNEKFVNIEEVVATKERLAKEEKKKEKKWAEKGVLAMETSNYAFESMCFEWQLDPE